MSDPINPDHYRRFPVEVIEITEHLSFNLGNAVKYSCRAGFKDAATEVQDLRKAAWYIDREIKRLESESSTEIEEGKLTSCLDCKHGGPASEASCIEDQRRSLLETQQAMAHALDPEAIYGTEPQHD